MALGSLRRASRTPAVRAGRAAISLSAAALPLRPRPRCRYAVSMWQLYQFPLCPFSRKVRLLLGEKGVGYELVRESPWERRDEFIDLNPAGRTPVMVDEERGQLLIDSNRSEEHTSELQSLMSISDAVFC